MSYGASCVFANLINEETARREQPAAGVGRPGAGCAATIKPSWGFCAEVRAPGSGEQVSHFERGVPATPAQRLHPVCRVSAGPAMEASSSCGVDGENSAAEQCQGCASEGPYTSHHPASRQLCRHRGLACLLLSCVSTLCGPCRAGADDAPV